MINKAHETLDSLIACLETAIPFSNQWDMLLELGLTDEYDKLSILEKLRLDEKANRIDELIDLIWN